MLSIRACFFQYRTKFRRRFWHNQVHVFLQASALHMPQELCELAGQDSTSEAAYALGPTGLDQVQFMLGAGPGEPLRPLAEVASGGESARLMLALKAAPAVVTNGDGQRIDNLTGNLETLRHGAIASYNCSCCQGLIMVLMSIIGIDIDVDIDMNIDIDHTKPLTLIIQSLLLISITKSVLLSHWS